MNVLMNYLETMFATYPQTPRLLEAKSELRAMMEDAYAALIAEGYSENEAIGRVISDFGNLDEVAPVLGITAELGANLGASVGMDAGGATARPGTPTPAPGVASTAYEPVTMAEAEGYADAGRRVTFRVARANTVLIMSPAVLIVAALASDAGALPITEDAAVFTGILVLFAIVIVGLALLFTANAPMAPFRRISEGRFSPNPKVTHWAELFADRHEHSIIRALLVAIALWIAAPVPLIAASLFLGDTPSGQLWIGVGIVVILVLVAAGLEILLRHAWPRTVADKLTGRTQRTRA